MAVKMGPPGHCPHDFWALCSTSYLHRTQQITLYKSDIGDTIGHSLTGKIQQNQWQLSFSSDLTGWVYSTYTHPLLSQSMDG